MLLAYVIFHYYAYPIDWTFGDKRCVPLVSLLFIYLWFRLSNWKNKPSMSIYAFEDCYVKQWGWGSTHASVCMDKPWWFSLWVFSLISLHLESSTTMVKMVKFDTQLQMFMNCSPITSKKFVECIVINTWTKLKLTICLWQFFFNGAMQWLGLFLFSLLM